MAQERRKPIRNQQVRSLILLIGSSNVEGLAGYGWSLFFLFHGG